MINIIRFINQAAQIYQLLMIIYIFSSWFPEARETGVIQFIGRLVSPFLDIFRRLIPSIGGMDFSPIIAFFAFQWGVSSLIQLLIRFML